MCSLECSKYQLDSKLLPKGSLPNIQGGQTGSNEVIGETNSKDKTKLNKISKLSINFCGKIWLLRTFSANLLFGLKSTLGQCFRF